MTMNCSHFKNSPVSQSSGRIPEGSSYNILPMEGLAGKITSSLHESNFACYNCINGITTN